MKLGQAGQFLTCVSFEVFPLITASITSISVMQSSKNTNPSMFVEGFFYHSSVFFISFVSQLVLTLLLAFRQFVCIFVKLCLKKPFPHPLQILSLAFTTAIVGLCGGSYCHSMFTEVSAASVFNTQSV